MALLLFAGTPQAQPDPATFGSRLESGDIAQLRAWLDAGLDPEYLADRIGTGLMIAAWRGDIPMMDLLLARGADVNADPMQWSALHYAAFAGHARVAILLLDLGADIDARSTNGSSALMMAVYEGHEQLVRQLLARGADRSVKNDRGEGAAEWAFKFQRLAIARLINTPDEFVARANLPKAHWGEPVRSQPAASAPQTLPPPEPADAAAGQIEELMGMRKLLAARGLDDAVSKLDRRIAALRAQRVRAERATPAAVLEISASRATPEDQKTRLIFGLDGPDP